ncbi:Acetylornithine aminotransferase [Thalassoglobus neptunius]|uniref:Acetylornithine aminotransferase n=1 Tax=Thalassoglobus neptunius TaxID=1938619 RepID=A0A5C5WAN5_9PLAN|nr:aminotransferase class III-fold pyridoxal phosphate-dependent enzyme [Thalassoglobus neptunius]TWT47918.1 Acetylornithine aminotransferase [Thalassoglobus neptunius]
MPDPTTQAAACFHDERILKARQLIRETISEYREALTRPSPPVDENKLEYEVMLKHFGHLRGGALYYPFLGSGFGNGALVELADGSVKFDMITGIGVHVAGHSNPDLIDMLVQAAISDSVMQGNLQQNLESLKLCNEVVGVARESGSRIRHCFLSTSGATANENALKMMFQAKFPADRILSFENCFAGRTMALAQLTDRPKNRDGLPQNINVDYIPFYDHDDPTGSTERSLAALKKLLSRYPGRHAGMCIELIQGEGGYYSAPREFFLTLIDHLRDHDVPIFFDEVQTFGRTSRLFAFQDLELDEYADVVSIGKMSQVCATLFTEEFKPRPGLVSQTFTGATSAIYAARFIINEFREKNFLGPEGRTMQIHERFAKHLNKLQSKFKKSIHGPWGCGGMIAFSVFDGSPERTKEFLDKLFHAGVIAFPAGQHPTRVRMLPPLLVITDEQIQQVCEIIGDVLNELG